MALQIEIKIWETDPSVAEHGLSTASCNFTAQSCDDAVARASGWVKRLYNAAGEMQ